ncbi:MAG TPA: hypothetical protein VGF45_04010 [Polyangia bacterium]
MRMIQPASIFTTFLAVGCGEPTDEPSPAAPASATSNESEGAAETTPAPIVDHESRSVRYALDCEGGEEPQLKLADKRSLTLSCPEPGGRRLKVVCPEGVEITKLGRHFDFKCQ